MSLAAFAACALWLFPQSSSDGALQLQRATDRVIARYPPVAANDRAIRLEQLAAQIGIDLAPPLPDRAHPLLSEKDLVGGLRLGAYLSAQAESAVDRVAAPDLSITQFLAERAESLENIRALLVDGTPPRWALDLAKGKKGEPDPNSEGPLVLQRILLSEALVEARASHPAEAELWLEASWRLKESMAVRPTLVWQLIAIAVSRWEAGVLRKLVSSDGGWVERMRFAPQRERVFRAMKDDFVIGFIDWPDPEELKRWSPVDLIQGIERSVEWLEKQDPCAFPRSEKDVYWKSFFPGPIEKTLAGIAMPSVGDAAHRLYRLQVEGELTARVIEARRSSVGESPAPPGGATDLGSAVCPGAHWSSLVLPDGATNVRFAGRFADWPDEAGIHPPLEFTIRAGSAGGGGGARP